MDNGKVIKGLGIVSRMLNEMGRRNEMDIVDDAISLLKEQEAVVRCKDCKHRHSLTGTCVNIDGACFHSYVGDDWFCADGERKEE